MMSVGTRQRLVEFLREFVIVSDKVGSLLPHRLHRDDRRAVVDKRAERTN